MEYVTPDAARNLAFVRIINGTASRWLSSAVLIRVLYELQQRLYTYVTTL
jgi:hypothetical protein